MNRPLVIVDEAAAALATDPEARRLLNQLLLAGRKNGVQEQPEPETGPRATLRLQYPTLAEFEAAAHRQ
ncbi:hypothetical protein [Streptomyces sp. NRRL F-2664]|uniref:hypothetical protein n=1 Tax=Streptomyces sp. NRRL F-2664 TaxID=1463842 RepID=UPI000997983D|nr:hypothetical protein [Streptomyces sp. NRRL F-2664]